MEEIDIIELLQRVKEGKAPKEIEIKGCKYKYNTLDEDYDYIRTGLDDVIYDLIDDYNIFDMLDTKIKILDKPIIEELAENDKIKDLIETISKLQKENEKLKAINSMQKYRIEVIDERELISKEKIREFIKKELPDDEIMECCSICDVNGVAIRKELEKILGDKEIN